MTEKFVFPSVPCQGYFTYFTETYLSSYEKGVSHLRSDDYAFIPKYVSVFLNVECEFHE